MFEKEQKLYAHESEKFVDPLYQSISNCFLGGDFKFLPEKPLNFAVIR